VQISIPYPNISPITDTSKRLTSLIPKAKYPPSPAGFIGLHPWGSAVGRGDPRSGYQDIETKSGRRIADQELPQGASATRGFGPLVAKRAGGLPERERGARLTISVALVTPCSLPEYCYMSTGVSAKNRANDGPVVTVSGLASLCSVKQKLRPEKV
jgi:hypothetical protein